ncbi:hypothetical protein MIND_00132500 [Mycena indigotica]|uniref:Glycosyltransferase 61 catalytic domain-containing protein n=1 Tax=Mycena indigotica TaxID=2126181 RepID=A0A8H6WIH7_9AGAR|nr:uncharacterized protein MIND_00132500 [Mycena indigotica]KAF7316143.1 hypothetical protein MIND_00132500 [Mycena indigotica]
MNSLRSSKRRIYLAVLIVNASAALIFLHAWYRVDPATPSPFQYAQALERSSSVANASSQWAPLALSSCSFAMPEHYAPCLAKKMSHVIHSEELLYPDFELRQPYFATDSQRDVWQKFAQNDPEYRDRAHLVEGWVRYSGQSGQNYVFHDVQYTRSFGPDIWSDRACMSKGVSTTSIEPLAADKMAKAFPNALIALSPDANSFQHFLDRVTHIVVQGSHLYQEMRGNVAVLTGQVGSKTVQELWKRMGFPENHVVHQHKSIAARRLIFSCRAVLVHPWPSLRLLEVLGVPDRHSTSVQRKKVLYMSRSAGQASNGRWVINEEAVLATIKSVLEERNLGEEMVIFNADSFHTVDELFSYVSQNALAIVGPHGGAMINHRWAQKDTFILEFMTENRIAMMIHEEASLLSQTYAAIVVPPPRHDSFDLEINVQHVADLLRRHLGVKGEDPLRKSYPWKVPELD